MELVFLSGDPIEHILHHNADQPMGPLGITKFTWNMWLSAGVLIVLVWKMKKDSMTPQGLLRGIFEALYLFIRDEMVYPTMGKHHGQKFMPFFMTVFTFILSMNIMGLVPLPVIGGAATSQFGLTLGLAAVVIAVSIGGGLVCNGPVGFLKSFVPSGLPIFIAPVIFILELFGFFIKHSVLAVRLMANMLGGHLVVGGFLALIFIFESYLMAAVSVPLALFINLLECLVAFLQAYVFTLLSVLFVGGTVHPDH